MSLTNEHSRLEELYMILWVLVLSIHGQNPFLDLDPQWISATLFGLSENVIFKVRSMKNANVFAGFVSNIEEYCIQMDRVNSFGATII